MKRTAIIPIILLLSVTSALHAQTLKQKAYMDSAKRIIGRQEGIVADHTTPGEDTKAGTMTKEERDLFYEMYIPSIIAKSGMAPADFDNFGFSFGDDKVNFSTGEVLHNSKNSIGLQLTAAAPNGASTLFKPGTHSYDFGATFKWTSKTEGSTWYVVDNDRPAGAEPIISSQRSAWWNFSYASDLQSLNVFDTDTSFTKKRVYTFELLVSINGVFNSLYFPRYIRRRLTWSAGLGVARFTNYSALDEITLHKGRYYSEAQAFSETDKTEGAMGPLEISTGALFRGAAYYPLTNPFGYTNVYLGATLNYFGMFQSNKLVNSNFGLYFSKRHADTEKKELVEDFSVGLIADFKNLQRTNVADYWKSNFKVLLSAQIPLRFD